MAEKNILIMGLSVSTISISSPTFECFQDKSHTLYKDIFQDDPGDGLLVPDPGGSATKRICPGCCEAYPSVFSQVTTLNAGMRIYPLVMGNSPSIMGIEHDLTGNIIHKCIMFSIAMFDYRVFVEHCWGEWNIWGDGMIDSMIDPRGALQAPSKRPSGNIKCLFGCRFKTIFGMFQIFSKQAPELVG